MMITSIQDNDLSCDRDSHDPQRHEEHECKHELDCERKHERKHGDGEGDGDMSAVMLMVKMIVMVMSTEDRTNISKSCVRA